MLVSPAATTLGQTSHPHSDRGHLPEEAKSRRAQPLPWDWNSEYGEDTLEGVSQPGSGPETTRERNCSCPRRPCLRRGGCASARDGCPRAHTCAGKLRAPHSVRSSPSRDLGSTINYPPEKKRLPYISGWYLWRPQERCVVELGFNVPLALLDLPKGTYPEPQHSHLKMFLIPSL